MELNTLRCMTTEICCREIDYKLEDYLPDYITQMTNLLNRVHEDLLSLPLELEPASVFSLVDRKNR